ncbi:P-type conjugative transfer protein TrbJ [Pelagerythrobacter aerophilus]|uniref:P-type conjugative transfer protein TrbJ n=1 Tax=Pelagerythrobacter aerophilus TaxID=2306995 RepID=A0A418NL15_9SPHN|nr:P-type conjugative transfer protein TrbJ [Pelagerythrobacter aerophilus]RIV80345.1 P-type conjugative transfer protein TrbJ [Pelagerythrobacter aerophilus]
MKIPARNCWFAGALGLGVTGALAIAIGMPGTPAHAQFTVFDPTNYSQNLLTAARTLEQINNQIRSLQNEAQMLIDSAKNLTTIDFPELDALRQRLQDIDRLMGQAQGIDFKLDELDEQFAGLFPESFEHLATRDRRIAAARHRLDTAMASFRQTMGIQSSIVENVREDAEALKAIVDKSQGAEGSLQAQQATNQLLALTTKQQFQLQQMMAAQFRSEAIEQARRGEIEREARENTRRFLGDGKAYTPRQ